jgi:hypothetical protein
VVTSRALAPETEEETAETVVWHRNGGIALGLALVPLASFILIFLGAPIPPVSGWLAVIGGTFGWRARNTRTARQGNWAFGLAVLTLIAVAGGAFNAAVITR